MLKRTNEQTNKRSNNLLYPLISMLLITAASCSALHEWSDNNNQKDPLNTPSEPKTQAGKTLKNFTNLSLKYTPKVFDTVSQYIPESRSRKEYTKIEELISALPAHPKELTRKKVVNTRGEVNTEIEVTLDQELLELALEFEKELDLIKPDPSLAQSLPYAEVIENGVIIGGDQIIRNDSITGAVTIELMNAEARGEDINEITQDLQEVTDGFMLDLSGDEFTRGHVVNSTGQWSGGVINYEIKDSITPENKEIILKALKEWEEKTGTIKFQDFRANDLASLILSYPILFHMTGLVEITDRSSELDGETNGMATLGYTPGPWNYFMLNQKKFKNKLEIKIQAGVSPEAAKIETDNEMLGTCLHELGHVIGLSHEHQRWDRDDFVELIDVSRKDDSNYVKVPQYVSVGRWSWRWVRILFWKVKLPFYVTTKEKNSRPYGNYDYLSIMNYSNKFKAKKIQQGYQIGDPIKRSSQLSPTDIELVKSWYQ